MKPQGPAGLCPFFSVKILTLPDQKIEEVSTRATDPELACGSSSVVTARDQRKGGMAMPTFAASVMCCLRGWRRSKGEAAVFVAIALLAATAADDRRDSQFWAVPLALGSSDAVPATSPVPATKPAPPSQKPSAVTPSPQN